MIIYAAGYYATGFSEKGSRFRILPPEKKEKTLELLASNQLHILESFHYMRDDYVATMRKFGHRVFMDSGAFSMMSQGIKIDVKKYAAYLHRHWDIINCASVLDAVGDAHATYLNQRALEDMGCPVLPCFHFGEDLKWLSYYLDNYEYITIGGMVPISNAVLRKWLDRIWQSHLAGPDGKPRARVHGFGLTSLDLINRYPWYSVDSTRWVMQAVYGAVLHPRFGDQLFLTISDESPQVKRKRGSFHTLSEVEKAGIEKIVNDEGFTTEELRRCTSHRLMFNLICFVRLQEKLKDLTENKTLTNELFS